MESFVTFYSPLPLHTANITFSHDLHAPISKEACHVYEIRDIKIGDVIDCFFQQRCKAWPRDTKKRILSHEYKGIRFVSVAWDSR